MLRTLRGRLTSQVSFEAGLRAILVLNLLDALFTLGWIESGLASEANPLMAMAIEHGAGPFLLSKVALVGFASLLLWRQRQELTARLALIPLGMLYAFVAGGHVGFAIFKGFEPILWG